MLPDQDDFLERLYWAHFKGLRVYALKMLKSEDLAEEVVQDTFHEAVRHIDTLMTHPNPGGWLWVTARNKVKHAERSWNQWVLRFVSLEATVPRRETATIEDCLSGQAAPLLKKIRTILTEEEWALLRRVTMEKTPYKVAAEELGITIWACQKRVQRIREKLREHLWD